jgi:hypothetical protein
LKRKRTLKSRERLQSAIVKAVEKDPYAGTALAGCRAKQRARFGRERTEIERLVRQYAHTAKAWPEIYSQWRGPARGQIALSFWQVAIDLCDHLLDMAVKHDTKRLKAVARASEAARQHKPEADSLRSEILDLKTAFERSGTPPLTTIQIARLLCPRCDYPGKSDEDYARVLETRLKTIDRFRRQILWTAQGGRPKTRTDKNPKAV